VSVQSRNFAVLGASPSASRYCQKPMPTTIPLLRRGALWAVLGLLAGCGYFGSGAHHHLGLPHKSAKAQAVQPVDPAAQALAGMVEAVGPSGAQPPIELRFSIRNRPQVGQDDEVDYALIPQSAGLGTIRLAFGSIEGLRVVDQGPSLAAIKPESDAPIFGSITIRPLKAGLFTLTAAVSVETSNGSVIWPFTIPVIAGEGPAQTAANQP
jgi:hypothetical protein